VAGDEVIIGQLSLSGRLYVVAGLNAVVVVENEMDGVSGPGIQ